MTWRTALRLGRVSNLPTVWTNVAAGLALNGGDLDFGLLLGLGFAASAFYVGGMYLNDAFDRGWDAQHRPERPIPSGAARAATVFSAGFALLAGGMFLLYSLSATVTTAAFHPSWPGARVVTLAPVQAGVVLVALILIYDLSHKQNPIAPLLMGLCRVALYVIAGLTWNPSLRPSVWAAALVLLIHLVGLSLLARREASNPRLPHIVSILIAAISLLDAFWLVVTEHLVAAIVAAGAFFLTRRMQRHIAGT